MESKRETERRMLEEFLVDNPYPAPVELDLPPLNVTLGLYHATANCKVAENELIVNKINLPKLNLTKAFKWTDIEKKKEIIRSLFTNSNKAIKENNASLSRFIEIIRDKSSDKVNLEAQMVEVTEDITAFHQVHVELESYVDEYSVFEEFLRNVAQAAPDFNSVGDILNHYETLEHTRRECARLLKEGLDEATRLRRVMTRLLMEKTSRLKELRNKLTTMQLRRKQAKETLTYWEQTLEKIKQQIKTSERERVVLGGACYDLYREMCQRRGVSPTAGVRDIDSQTDFIMKTIAFYKEVITIATSVKQAREKPYGDDPRV